jgi:hypothetical protein
MLEKLLFGTRLKLELIELKQSDALDYKYLLTIEYIINIFNKK